MSQSSNNTKGDLSQSKNLIQDNIEQLKQLFPSIVSEGKINFTELQTLLGEHIEPNKESYSFTWAGKTEAKKEALKPSTATLRPNKKR